MSIAIFIFYKPSISTGPIMPCSKIAILGPPLDVGLPLRAACIRCCNTASTTKLQDKDLAEKGSHLYGKSAACSVAYSGARLGTRRILLQIANGRAAHSSARLISSLGLTADLFEGSFTQGLAVKRFGGRAPAVKVSESKSA